MILKNKNTNKNKSYYIKRFLLNLLSKLKFKDLNLFYYINDLILISLLYNLKYVYKILKKIFLKLKFFVSFKKLKNFLKNKKKINFLFFKKFYFLKILDFNFQFIYIFNWLHKIFPFYIKKYKLYKVIKFINKLSMTNILYSYNFFNFKEFILYYIYILNTIKKNLILIKFNKFNYLYKIINKILIILNELNKVNFLKINFLFFNYNDLIHLLNHYNKNFEIK